MSYCGTNKTVVCDFWLLSDVCLFICLESDWLLLGYTVVGLKYFREKIP